MSIWRDPSALLPGLKPGAFRGVPFHVPDISHSVGRRIVLTWFPGIDDPAADDLGRHAGPVRVRGLILGDDYIVQARALEAAFQAAGPGTLLHPWLGEMTVVVPEDGGQISFASTELRIVRFDATFQRVATTSAVLVSTLSALLGAATSMVTAATTCLSRVLGGSAVGVSTWSAAIDTATAIGSIVADACATHSAAAALDAATEDAQSALSVAATAGAGASAAQAIASALAGLCRPIATAAIGTPRPAIGPGGAARDPEPALSARAGASLLLAIATSVRETQAVGAHAAAARLVGQVAALAEAVRAGAEIEWESRQDATSWHDAIDTALDGAATDAAAVAGDLPAEVAGTWSALAQLRGALARDLNEVVGRLPAVRLVAPAGTVSAWLIATHYAGDDATEIVPMLDDIVRRNRLRHPGAVPPEPLEVLL